MAILSIQHVRIAGISAVVPSTKKQNSELSVLSEEEKQLLVETTGIKTRRVADRSLKTTDLCQRAAEELLQKLPWSKSEIDVLILVTQTPDQPIPGSSMQLQDRLGLPKSCMAIDLNQGCAGYVYGLATIMSLLSGTGLKKGLLLVGDTITHLLDEDDQSTIPIFSDAGTATAIEFDTSAQPTVFNLQTDGAGCDAIMQKPGESMKMSGHEVFHFGLKEVAQNIKILVEDQQTDLDEIDYVVFHQANLLLNESIRRKLKLPAEKVPYSLQEFGNTSCSTIPLTLVNNLREEISQNQTKCILSGFGVGLSWGSTIIQLENVVCPPLIEI